MRHVDPDPLAIEFLGRMNACSAATERIEDRVPHFRGSGNDLIRTAPSDGTVDMSYEFGAFQVPKVDYATAQLSARQKCQAWGYSDAEAFGGEKRVCQQRDNYGGCISTFVTVTYQCTGANTPG